MYTTFNFNYIAQVPLCTETLVSLKMIPASPVAAVDCRASLLLLYDDLGFTGISVVLLYSPLGIF